MPSYLSIHKISNDLKSELRVMLGPDDVGIREYPKKLDLLPDIVHKTAYDDGAPISKHLDRLLNTARNHVPLRKSSKLLKSDVQQPTSTAVAIPQTDAMAMLQTVMMHPQQPRSLQVPQSRSIATS